MATSFRWFDVGWHAPSIRSLGEYIGDSVLEQDVAIVFQNFDGDGAVIVGSFDEVRAAVRSLVDWIDQQQEAQYAAGLAAERAKEE